METQMSRNRRKGLEMTLKQRRMIMLAVVILIGFLLGRLAVRAFMNLLLGGTLFGGNFL